MNDDTTALDYVVTFEPGGMTTLAGLRRMSLADAQRLVQMAERVPMYGRIVRVTTR